MWISNFSNVKYTCHVNYHFQNSKRITLISSTFEKWNIQTVFSYIIQHWTLRDTKILWFLYLYDFVVFIYRSSSVYCLIVCKNESFKRIIVIPPQCLSVGRACVCPNGNRGRHRGKSWQISSIVVDLTQIGVWVAELLSSASNHRWNVGWWPSQNFLPRFDSDHYRFGQRRKNDSESTKKILRRYEAEQLRTSSERY